MKIECRLLQALRTSERYMYTIFKKKKEEEAFCVNLELQFAGQFTLVFHPALAEIHCFSFSYPNFSIRFPG